MGSLLNDNLFLVLLIFGGALVCIRAHELYAVPSPKNDARWLVDEMQLRFLTGRRQFATGFIFYMLPLLFIYLLLSVSPEMLSLLMGVTGMSNSVGALTLTGSQVNTFAPLLASTVVVTLLSIKPFTVFENYIRRVSHGVAGIPQHIQDIVREIRQMDFRSMTSESLSPGNFDHVQAIPGLDNDLAAIAQLDDWTIGRTGTLIWSERSNTSLQQTRQRVSTDYSTLKRKLAMQATVQNDDDSGEQSATVKLQDEIVRRSRELRVDFTRLLAVLVANQDEPLPENVQSEPLWSLISRAQRLRASSRHFNILTTSTLVGIALSMPFATIYNVTIVLVHDLTLDNATINFTDATLHITGRSLAEFYWSSLIHAVQAAWWDVLGASLLFIAGCSAALAYRAARRNSAAWELWHAHSHPVFQYIIVALLACMSACFVYELFLLCKLVILPSLQVRNTGHFASMLKDFGTEYIGFGMLAILIAPCAIMVCRLSDNFGSPSEYPSVWRDPWIHTLAWSTGLMSMAIYLVLRLTLDDNYALSDVLLSLVVPATTLFIMCCAYWRIGEQRPQPAQQPGGNALALPQDINTANDVRLNTAPTETLAT
ncbi:MAG: hypothetical protein AB8B97_26825 [Granulosicoccus sp.]